MSERAGHGKTVCSCGVVIAQCRCMDHGGQVTVLKDGCRACKDPHAVVQAKLAQRAVLTLEQVAADLTEARGLIREFIAGRPGPPLVTPDSLLGRAHALLARIDGKDPG